MLIRRSYIFANSVLWLPFIRQLSNLDLFSKKTLRASEQEREDIKQQRENWQEFQANVEPGRLVFLDESGVKTNMTRLYGRASKGARCHDKAPDGRWETVTVLSSIRLDGETESVMFEGATDRKMFDAYIEEILGPTLRPGDIVVMDNVFQQCVAVFVTHLHQLFVEMLDGEVKIPGLKKRDDAHGFINRDTPGGHFADSAINKPCLAFLGKSLPLAVKSTY